MHTYTTSKNRNMKTFEKWAEADLKKRVKAAVGKVIKLGGNQENGLPDDLVIMKGGYHFYIELKSLGKTVNRLQDIQASQLYKLGCCIWEVNSASDLELFYLFIGLDNWEIKETIKDKYAV